MTQLTDTNPHPQPPPSPGGPMPPVPYTCGRCGAPVEHVSGLNGPYWQHLDTTDRAHSAAPTAVP